MTQKRKWECELSFHRKLENPIIITEFAEIQNPDVVVGGNQGFPCQKTKAFQQPNSLMSSRRLFLNWLKYKKPNSVTKTELALCE